MSPYSFSWKIAQNFVNKNRSRLGFIFMKDLRSYFKFPPSVTCVYDLLFPTLNNFHIHKLGHYRTLNRYFLFEHVSFCFRWINLHSWTVDQDVEVLQTLLLVQRILPTQNFTPKLDLYVFIGYMSLLFFVCLTFFN